MQADVQALFLQSRALKGAPDASEEDVRRLGEQSPSGRDVYAPASRSLGRQTWILIFHAGDLLTAETDRPTIN